MFDNASFTQYCQNVCDRAMSLCSAVLAPYPSNLSYSPSAYPPPGSIGDIERDPYYKAWMSTGYYRGAGDSSLTEKQLWFDDPETVEFLTCSRPYDCLNRSALMPAPEVQRRVAELLDQNIEKLVIWRCQNNFAKEVGPSAHMVVGVLSLEDWCWYIKYHLDPVGNYTTTYRQTTLPDHEKTHSFMIQRVTWTGNQIPRLYNKFWWYKKYLGKDMVRYRALVRNFTLVRNYWTGVVKVEFEYDTWRWHQEDRNWFYV